MQGFSQSAPTCDGLERKKRIKEKPKVRKKPQKGERERERDGPKKKAPGVVSCGCCREIRENED